MATDKKAAADAEVKETAEKIEEAVETEETVQSGEPVETEENVQDEAPVEAEENVQDEAPVEAEEAAEDAAPAEEKAAEAAPAEEKPVKVSSKRIKKTERREAKAARKAANKIEEKKTRPNNLLIGLMIFGVVIGMFAFVLGYNYFSKPATIEKYIEKNGGKDSFSGMQLDELTTADVTAEGNSMKITFTAKTDDKELSSTIREYYSGDDGKEMLEYYAEQMLTSIKPQTRAFSADVKAVFNLNDEEINSVEMTYKEAKEKMEEAQKEAEEAADKDADTHEHDDAEDAADDAADTTEDAAADAAEESGE